MTWISAVFSRPIRRGLLLFIVSVFAAAIMPWSPASAAASVTVEPGLVISDDGSNALTEYRAGAAGNATPVATIAGAKTKLSAPAGLVVAAGGRVLVTNVFGDSVTEYAPGASGDVAPVATIAGTKTGLNDPEDVAVGASGRVFVLNGNASAGSVTEYARGASGDVAPLATIAGANTGLNAPRGLALNAAGRLFVTNAGSNAITEYASGASGNVAPVATIVGAKTGLVFPQAIAIGHSGRIFVTNTGCCDAVAVYAAGASGNVGPIATMPFGDTTTINTPLGLAVDGAGRVAVTNGSGTVTEYARGALGHVAPFSTISGPRTGLDGPAGAALVTPTVMTGRARPVTTHSATLRGTVNPQGSDTHFFFQYGRTTAYGKTTPIKNAGAGGSPLAAMTKVTSLPAGSTFHYRLVASSDAGTRYGTDRRFTTKRTHRP
jgi:sugar lactone lactonase YvrE